MYFVHRSLDTNSVKVNIQAVNPGFVSVQVVKLGGEDRRNGADPEIAVSTFMVPALACVAYPSSCDHLLPFALYKPQDILTDHRLSFLLLYSIIMYSLAFLSLAAAVAASVTPPALSHHVEGIEVPAAKEIIPAITVVEENRAYAVKLECTGCPFVSWKRPREAEWQHPPPDNSLVSATKQRVEL